METCIPTWVGVLVARCTTPNKIANYAVEFWEDMFDKHDLGNSVACACRSTYFKFYSIYAFHICVWVCVRVHMPIPSIACPMCNEEHGQAQEGHD